MRTQNHYSSFKNKWKIDTVLLICFFFQNISVAKDKDFCSRHIAVYIFFKSQTHDVNVKLFFVFKNGDQHTRIFSRKVTDISFLSHVYKQLSNRLVRGINNFLPPEEADFRTGCSIVNHIQTLRQVTQKTESIHRCFGRCLQGIDWKDFRFNGKCITCSINRQRSRRIRTYCQVK